MEDIYIFGKKNIREVLKRKIEKEEMKGRRQRKEELQSSKLGKARKRIRKRKLRRK